MFLGHFFTITNLLCRLFLVVVSHHWSNGNIQVQDFENSLFCQGKAIKIKPLLMSIVQWNKNEVII